MKDIKDVLTKIFETLDTASGKIEIVDSEKLKEANIELDQIISIEGLDLETIEKVKALLGGSHFKLPAFDEKNWVTRGMQAGAEWNQQHVNILLRKNEWNQLKNHHPDLLVQMKAQTDLVNEHTFRCYTFLGKLYAFRETMKDQKRFIFDESVIKQLQEFEKELTELENGLDFARTNAKQIRHDVHTLKTGQMQIKPNGMTH